MPEVESANRVRSATPAGRDARSAIKLVREIAARYEIQSLERLIAVCESAGDRHELGVAVLGRFKAGKSSFLNHFIGRKVLPVGVVPVTSVITELAWANEERCRVRFLDGRDELVGLADLPGFITEAGNPENGKRVDRVTVSVRDLASYRGLRFIDTPGLESAFAHNTDVSLHWIPNVDIALVAVGVDPPLSQQDVSLIRKLLEYTPKVCVLLTKVDAITEDERVEVLDFVHAQLNRNFEQNIAVFPYSTREGFESLRQALEENFLLPTLATVREQKEQIVERKVQTLVRECGEYVRLRLRSAEIIDSERQQLRHRAFDDTLSVADTKLALQLATRHVIAQSRAYIEKVLAPYQRSMGTELTGRLASEYPAWRTSFGKTLVRFEEWLRAEMTCQVAEISQTRQSDFLQPLYDLQRQYRKTLQAFRDQLSERTMELFGVSLRTTETEIAVRAPRSPDVQIGRIFDHNWELLSAILPMALLRGVLRRRFVTRVEEETFKNLCRLTAQWLDVVSATALQMQKEAEERLREVIDTVDRLTASPSVDIRQIRWDLDQLESLHAKQRKES